ncbi:hypothetical protein ACU639_02155 [Streptomyces cynarae]|uniref:hypothetical protein n=1 Tax=Streptomyces cynarae TaxID=2981134 RepID=UPI00406D00E4
MRDDITMLGQLGVFPPSPAVALRMLAWRVTGRAARAATSVTAQAAEAVGLAQGDPGRGR